MSRIFTAFIGLFRRKPATLVERVAVAPKLTPRTQAGLLGAHVGQAGNIYTISKFRARK